MNQNLDRVHAKIDLNHLAYNLNSIKSHLTGDVHIMAVVKADAYGHGSVEITKELERLGVKFFAVATVDEGINLRKEGINAPILVLGYTFSSQYKMLIEYDLTQSILTVDMARGLQEVAKENNGRIKCHIEIDTGMSRLGFLHDDDLVEKALIMKKMNNLDIKGIFTHFAKADEEDKAYTEIQLKRFNQIIEALEDRGLSFEYIHASNSAGVIDHKKAHFNMARPGISLYGLYPSDEVNQSAVDLKPVLSLMSKIVSLKELPKDTPISYGGAFVTTRKTKVAVVPVGYGDGYPRRLSSVGKVIVNNQYAPILGRVCMDKFMIDVTDIEDVVIENDVVLIGESESCVVTVEEIASHMHTINYEVICQLGKRIPRIYCK